MKSVRKTKITTKISHDLKFNQNQFKNQNHHGNTVNDRLQGLY